MAGSIRRRSDRGTDAWELRVFLGRDDSGRIRQKTVLFRGTRRQAEVALARLVSEIDAQPAKELLDPPPTWASSTTINQAISGWEHNGWADLSPSTVLRYRSIWRTHIEDSIGRRAIVTLSPYEVERYFRALKDRGLSEASVRQTRALLHRACRLARKWSGNVLANPIADTELPQWRLEEQGVAVRAPSVEEVRRIIDAAAPDLRIATFIRVIAATGMRRGEACALRWEDVDLESASLRVDESIVNTAGGTEVKGPKTRASIRRLGLDRITLQGLQTLHAKNLEDARFSETALTPRAFVFSTGEDPALPPHPDSMSHAFSRARELAGVADDVHLHSLRHFQATALDAVISEAQNQARLGWATVHMARHYTDAIGEEDRRAAEHIGLLLDAGAAPPSSAVTASTSG